MWKQYLSRFAPSKNLEWVWVYIFIPALLAYIILLTKYLNMRPLTGFLEPHHENFSQLIFPDSQIEIIATDFSWTEGPLWINNDENGNGYLLFSDTIKNQIWKWEDGHGLFTIGKSLYLLNSGCRNNLTWCEMIKESGSNGLRSLGSQSKDILICQHGNRRVGVLYLNGTFKTIASHYKGYRLNSPNDVAISYDKRLYFTDPPYGLFGKESNELLEKDLPHNGVYMVDKGDFLLSLSSGIATNNAILVDDQLSRPNGIALSPGSTRLYVSNSDRKFPVWKVYDINPESGKLENGQIFYNCEHLYPSDDSLVGNPDGFKIDMNGNLFASGPGGVLVISPDGTLLGRIRVDRKVSNVAFGGDGYLYITATDQVLRVPVRARPLASISVG